MVHNELNKKLITRCTLYVAAKFLFSRESDIFNAGYRNGRILSPVKMFAYPILNIQ